MPDDEKAELERVKAENERLRRTASRGITFKVSEKGGVSVYGLGRSTWSKSYALSSARTPRP